MPCDCSGPGLGDGAVILSSCWKMPSEGDGRQGRGEGGPALRTLPRGDFWALEAHFLKSRVLGLCVAGSV